MHDRVGPEGSLESKVMLIGEAPGETEVREGRPFVGTAGKLLDGVLEEAGLVRSECYLTNVMQTRPPGNDFGCFYEGYGKPDSKGKLRRARKKPSSELLEGLERLRHEINLVGPNIIVCLGSEAFRALTERSGDKITDWRGSVVKVSPYGKVMPTYHPSAVLRQWKWRPLLVFDLGRAKEESKFPGLRRRRRDLLINPSLVEALEYLNECKKKGVCAFDIETSTNQIQSISFAHEPESSICIPFWFEASGSLWTEEEELILWRVIKEVLEDPRVRKIAQNGQYDITWLRDGYGIEVRNFWWDTMIAHALLYPELPRSLAMQCSIYTDQPYYKSGLHTKDMNEFWRYNALDSSVTFECCEKQEDQLKKWSMDRFYRDHEHEVNEVLMKMSQRGVRIDQEKRKDAQKRYKKKLEEMQKLLEESAKRELNANSPKQVQNFLYETLKLPKQYTTSMVAGKKQKRLTTDELALKKLQVTNKHPALQLIQDIHRARRILSTYLKAELEPDGRMRCSYIVGANKKGTGGTETGRLSSQSNPYGRGTNLQNIPNRAKDPEGIVKSLFVPDEGKVFVQGDLSQAEARIVAHLANETRLLRVFEMGGDVHRKTASMIFMKPEAEVTSEERYLAKRTVHASNYGMGPKTFRDQLFMELGKWLDLKVVKAIQNRYFTAFPGIKAWHMRVGNELRKTLTMCPAYACSGQRRRRQFMGRWGQDLVREALAYNPQSSVADVLKEGLRRLEKVLETEEGHELLLTVHDSVIVQCPSGQESRCIEVTQEALTVPLWINGNRVEIPVDFKVGDSWDSLETVRREEDAKEKKEEIHEPNQASGLS